MCFSCGLQRPARRFTWFRNHVRISAGRTATVASPWSACLLVVASANHALYIFLDGEYVFIHTVLCAHIHRPIRIKKKKNEYFSAIKQINALSSYMIIS